MSDIIKEKAMLPNFLVIGAPKAGTTSMCHYLSQHPSFFISNPKELHFFCDDDLYSRGLDWYRQQFSGGENAPFRGEGTPFYSMSQTFPNVLPRLQQDLPEIKIVYMVRHPLKRMESYFSQEINNGWNIPGFCQAVQSRSHYVDASFYYKQLTNYERAYGKENTHVVFFEDFIDDCRASLDGVLNFLGADVQRWKGNLDHVNRRDLHLQDTHTMRALRSFPGFRLVVRNRKWLLPSPVRSFLKKTLRRSPTSLPIWDEATMRWAVDQVKEDTANFLAFMGRPADHWGDLSRPCEITN